MAMAGGADSDAGGEVEEGITVDVFDNSAVSTLGDERVVAGERRGHELGVLLDAVFCFGPRELRDEAGQFRLVRFRFRRFRLRGRDHFFLLQGWPVVSVEG